MDSKLQQELKQNIPFASLEVEVWLNLRRTMDCLGGELRRMLKAHGVSEPQFNVLRILRGSGPEGLPSLEVANRMVTRVPDITRLLDRLAKRHLVSRDRCTNDRRVVLCRITRSGLELLAGLDAPSATLHKRILAHMSEEHLQQLNDLLVEARSGTETS